MASKPSAFVRRTRSTAGPNAASTGPSGTQAKPDVKQLVGRTPIGTEISPKNGQLLVSSGVPSFDALIGGGLAIGSMLLIDEDQHAGYSRMLSKFFLCEGAAAGHQSVVASAERNPEAIVSSLHPPVSESTKSTSSRDETSGKGEGMEIAWRYRDMRKVESEVGIGATSRIGHNFDVNKTLDAQSLAAAKEKSLCISMRSEMATQSAATPAHGETLSHLSPAHAVLFEKIRKAALSFAVGQKKSEGERQNVLRIVIESLGSPFWPSTGSEHYSMMRFLYKLRGLLRQSYAVCVLTTPGHLLRPNVYNRMMHFSDITIGLESFAGTPREHTGVLKDYHGLFRLLKLPRLNSLTHFMPETLDLAFKLKRKRLVIEKIHLPPDLSETVSRSQGDAPAHKEALSQHKSKQSLSCQPNPTKPDPLDF